MVARRRLGDARLVICRRPGLCGLLSASMKVRSNHPWSGRCGIGAGGVIRHRRHTRGPACSASAVAASCEGAPGMNSRVIDGAGRFRLRRAPPKLSTLSLARKSQQQAAAAWRNRRDAGQSREGAPVGGVRRPFQRNDDFIAAVVASSSAPGRNRARQPALATARLQHNGARDGHQRQRNFTLDRCSTAPPSVLADLPGLGSVLPRAAPSPAMAIGLRIRSDYMASAWHYGRRRWTTRINLRKSFSARDRDTSITTRGRTMRRFSSGQRHAVRTAPPASPSSDSRATASDTVSGRDVEATGLQWRISATAARTAHASPSAPPVAALRPTTHSSAEKTAL